VDERNVQAAVRNWMTDHGVEYHQNWGSTFRWLEENGYATAVYGPGHKSRREFRIMDDVDVSGYSVRIRGGNVGNGGKVKQEKSEKSEAVLPGVAVPSGFRVSQPEHPEKSSILLPPALPPMPNSKTTPKHWGQLTSLLNEWAEAEPDYYEQWAGTLIAWLLKRSIERDTARVRGVGVGEKLYR
jgi:hypothetical protein